MNHGSMDHILQVLRELVGELMQDAGRDLDRNSKENENRLSSFLVSLEDFVSASGEWGGRNEQLYTTQEGLEAQLRHYRDLFDFTPAGYLTTGPSGVIREANQAAAKLFGLPQDALVGQRIEGFFAEDCRASFRSRLNQLEQGEGIQDWMLELKLKHGHRAPAAVTLAAVRGAAGRLVALQWLIRDCSQCKYVKEALQQSCNELELCLEERSTALAENNRQLTQTITELKCAQEALDERLRFESLLSELSTNFFNLPSSVVAQEIEHGLQLIVESLGVDRSTLYEISEDKRQLKATHSWTAPGFSPALRFVSFDEFPWVTEKVLRGKTIQFSSLNDLPDEAVAEKAFLLKEGPKAAVAIPLVIAGSVLGAVTFSSLSAERTWSADLVQRLRLVGEIFANVLKRKGDDEAEQRMLGEIQRLQQQLKVENIYLREEIKTKYNFDQIIGQSDALKYLLFKAEQVAPTDATVLLLGETGTGKELIARAIHNMSPRKDRPMVKVNCAALPANLIESELFGREKGAFTGAQARQVGRFEVADRGTLFLDEIGELPQELQVKLLRVLQDGEFERLGSPRTIKVDVRIIAATNCDLEKKIQHGLFREDLYYRLQVFPITLPPLRERKGDIPLLVQWFVKKFALKMGRTIESVPTEAMAALESYPWPGNVRELENVIERAVINTTGRSLCLMDPLKIPKAQSPDAPCRKSLEEVETDCIYQALDECRWQIEGTDGAASVLGLNPSTLRGRMRKLGIQRPKGPHRG